MATRGYEAYRLTAGHNSNRRPIHRLHFCQLSTATDHDNTTPSQRKRSVIFYLLPSFTTDTESRKQRTAITTESLQNQHRIQIYTTIDSCLWHAHTIQLSHADTQGGGTGKMPDEKIKKISITANKIWLFDMPDSFLSRRALLGRVLSRGKTCEAEYRARMSLSW
jgi:hypothetical protein